jgi:hypothetical protein
VNRTRVILIDCRETYDHALLSFPLSDIERTLDAMSWVHVRPYIHLTRSERASDGFTITALAQYVPLACRRQPELPARRA